MIGIDMFHADVTLGRNFLEHYVIQIDYPNQRLRFFDRKELDLRKHKNIKSQTDANGLLIASVNLNDQKDMWLTLNTSSTYGLLVRRVSAEDLGWLDDYELSSSRNSGVVTSVNVSTLVLPKITLGPHEIRDVEVRVPLKGQAITASSTRAGTGSHQKGKKVKGTVGYKVLKDFVLTIDYKKGRLHVGRELDPYLEPDST